MTGFRPYALNPTAHPPKPNQTKQTPVRTHNTKRSNARRCAVVCSYLEVYNDQIFDLLTDEPPGGARRPVRLD